MSPLKVVLMRRLGNEPFLRKNRWVRSILQFSKMAAPSCIHILRWNLKPSHFRTFFGWDYDIFSRPCDLITMCGFPQNWGFPADVGRFHQVMWTPITKINVTIPVLLKTLFSARFHPPFPPCPTPLAPPFLPPPHCLFPQPLPTTICPPLPIVNRRLKIVNYFTCMWHFFCRW